MSRATRTLAVVAALLSVGCASDPVEVQQEPRPSFAVAATCSETLNRLPQNFTDYWNCGQKIRINLTGLPGALQADASAAIAEWNNALSADSYGLPVLSTTTGSPTINAKLHLNQTGALYCGQVQPVPPATPTTINMSVGNCGTFHDVFLHELSHVYGFKDAWEKLATIGVSDHCARVLRDRKAINEAVCRHEVETLHWMYQIRTAGQVSLDKHIITGLSGLASRTIFVGGTATLTVGGFSFARGQCGEGSCSPAPSAISYTWTPSSSAIRLTGSGASRTVEGVSPGTPTVTVVPIANTAFDIASELTGNRPTVTVQAVPPPARPTSLTATQITSTSARINWTNGDTSTGTTTFLEYRITGQSAWLKANGGVGLPAGQSSYVLTGLQCATSYDVNIYHRKNGVNSAALTLTLFSTAACQTSTLNPPSAFRATSCIPSSTGGKPYITYGVAWTAGSNPSSSLFHIVESNSNNPATGTVIRSGPITTVTSSVGPYLVTTNAAPRYFWVRHVNGSQSSVLVPIEGNPLQIKSPGCAL